MTLHRVSECFSCGRTTAPLFRLHLVYLHQRHRRLCAPCVLKSHPGSFCPICFDLFSPSPPPPSHRLMCLSCPSITHLSCHLFPSESPYQCPSCGDPDYFEFDHSNLLDDWDSAKKLFTAAKIASVSMSKAAENARLDAEARIKEAVIAKRKAREALEELDNLVMEEKRRRKYKTMNNRHSNNHNVVDHDDFGLFVHISDIIEPEVKKRSN